MSDFDLNQNEKTLECITFTEDKKRKEISDMSAEALGSLKRAEEKERKFLGDSQSISDMWEDAVKNIRSIYYPDQELKGLTKSFYSLMGYFGVDMHTYYANKILDTCDNIANRIKRRLDAEHERLYSQRGKIGLKIQLDNEVSIVEEYANAYVNTQKALEENMVEIEKERSEINELKSSQSDNISNDDNFKQITYLTKNIKDLLKEKEDYIDTLTEIGSKINTYDVKIDTKRVLANSLEIVYSKGTRIYNKLISKIEIAREFVKNGSFMDSNLSTTVKELETAVESSKKLTELERTFGDVLVETGGKIKEKMNDLEQDESKLLYREKIQTSLNEDKYHYDQDIQSKIIKYATVPLT